MNLLILSLHHHVRASDTLVSDLEVVVETLVKGLEVPGVLIDSNIFSDRLVALEYDPGHRNVLAVLASIGSRLILCYLLLIVLSPHFFRIC